MLENCLSGSEGGGAIALPTPIIAPSRYLGGYVDELIDRDSLAVILQQHLATSRKFPEC
jgi:hypothetical protein